MAPDSPQNYIQRARGDRLILESRIQNGLAKPVFLSHILLLTLPVVIALLVPRRRGGHLVRPVALALTVGLAAEGLCNRRMLLGANGYMVGLIAVWWLVWSATLLIFNDVERDFMRIERRQQQRQRHADAPTIYQNGSTQAKASKTQPAHEFFVWQPYPQTLSHRINWVLSLVANMRGPEWNWRISSMDALPAPIQSQLSNDPHHPHHHHPHQHPRTKHKTPPPAPIPPHQCLHSALKTALTSYLVIDAIKTLMTHDPYFFGLTPLPPPLPSSLSALLLRTYRVFLSATGIYTALVFVTALNPLFFQGLSLAFPNAARALTAVPLDQSWLYPSTNGPFLPSVLDNGLPGCWGTWWHQLFRFGLTSPAAWMCSFLPRSVTARKDVKLALTALTAFVLSGAMHACGSFTQVAATRPVAGTFAFFTLQAAGIIVQVLGSAVLVGRKGKGSGSGSGSESGFPRSVRRAANFVFVLVWFYLTGALIADDFARGGLWLTEPLPVSLFRGLGLGVEGDGWWCWRESWFEAWDDGSGFWGRGTRVV